MRRPHHNGFEVGPKLLHCLGSSTVDGDSEEDPNSEYGPYVTYLPTQCTWMSLQTPIQVPRVPRYAGGCKFLTPRESSVSTPYPGETLGWSLDFLLHENQVQARAHPELQLILAMSIPCMKPCWHMVPVIWLAYIRLPSRPLLTIFAIKIIKMILGFFFPPNPFQKNIVA